MANSSLSYVRLSDQELTALNNVIKLGFEAFEIVGYPYYFDYFLTAIQQSINLASMAVQQAFPQGSYHQFSTELDKLSGFMRDVQLLSLKKDKTYPQKG